MSDKRIPLAGVIGTPIEHSKSPVLHGHWLKTYGIAGHYIPMNIARKDLEQVIRTLPRMGFVGLNVTIPHKEAALKLADKVSDRAALIGSANTLIFAQDGSIHADNTDGYGFIENLRSGAPNWSAAAGPAVVLGAGGAARAVISSLLDAGVPEIRLANRTRARADAMRSEFGTRIEVTEWVKAGEMIEGAATVINTTSLGMVGMAELNVSMVHLSSEMVVTDLVYNPLETAFLKSAREAGCQVVDGLGMLLHQAAPGFERWFGQRPEVDDATRNAVLSA
jgi:shikimate dehydrogenase